MKTITVNISVPDDRYGELRDLLNKFKATEPDDLITLAQACREFSVSSSTLDRWVNHLKVVPSSQPVPNGKKFVRRSDLRRLLEIKEEKKARPKKRKSILNMR